jgi:hypothetical protein
VTTQCVGPSLDVDDAGVLHSRLAGNPPSAALPASGNGTRIDPDRGLWTPAEHRAVQIGAAREDVPGGGNIPTGNNRAGEILTATVVNPSATRSLLCYFTATFRAIFTIPQAVAGNAGYTGWQLLAGIDTDTNTGTPTLDERIARRDQGVASGPSRMSHSDVITGHLVIAPGQTSWIRARMGMGCFEFGYVQPLHFYTDLRGLGVTL